MLGCWKGALLPTSQEPALAEEAAHLFAQLRPCGWRGLDPALLKVLSSPGWGRAWGELCLRSRLPLAAGRAERRSPPRPC